MSNTKSNINRRKLIKSLALGSGAVVVGREMPESWFRPVIKSVVLPAHAQTSGGSPPAALNYYAQSVSPVVMNTDSIENGFVQNLSNLLIGTAHAQQDGGNALVEMSASVTDNLARVLFTPSVDPTVDWALFEANVAIDGSEGGVDLGPGGQCMSEIAEIWPVGGEGPQGISVIGYTYGDNFITIQLRGGRATRRYTLPLADGTASAVDCTDIAPS